MARRRKRNVKQGIGLILIALGMAVFLGLFAWQQHNSSPGSRTNLSALHKVLEPVQDSSNRDLVKRVLRFAEAAQADELFSNSELNAVDRAIRRAAKDGQITDGELIDIANVVSQPTTGLPVLSRSDITRLLKS